MERELAICPSLLIYAISIIFFIKSFGWDVSEVDGHNQIELKEVLSKNFDRPHFVLANTVKGKGCKIMESNPEWHHKFPTEEEYSKILHEIF